MTITKNVDGEKITLIPEGMLDTAHAVTFEQEVDKAAEETKDLTIDLSKISYISSSGLRILLKAQKKMRMKGKMQVKNINDNIKEVFEVTGFMDILTIV